MTEHQSTADFLADIEAEIATLDEQIAPLAERRSGLHQMRQEAREILATETADEVLLARMSADVRAANERVEAAARALSPMVLGTSHWLPTGLHRIEDYSQGYFTGLRLGLHRDATAEDLTVLADAMVAFNHRFQPTLPTYPEWTPFEDGAGAAYASLLAYDTGENHSWAIWYEPTPGGHAVLLDLWPYREIHTEGTLVEVLTAAAKVGYYRS